MLGLLIVLAVLAATLGLASAPLVLRDALIQYRWRRAAIELGFAFTRGGLTGGDRMSGTVDGFGVVIENMRRNGTRIVVSGAFPKSISLSRTRFADWTKDDALLTGDRAFDSQVAVRGAHLDVLPRI